MTCQHSETRVVREYCFAGPICGAEVHRAAHGGVTFEIECRACGARREENRNQGFREIGPWGLSRADRVAVAHREVQRLLCLTPPVPPPLTLHHSDGRRAVVECDCDGMLSGLPDGADGAIRGTPFFAMAIARRKWWLAFERAREASR